MNEALESIRSLLPFFLCCWGFFIVLVIWRPQKYFNSLVLMFNLMFTLIFMAQFFGPYASSALIISFLLISFGIMLVPFMLMFNGITMMRKESKSLGNLLSLILGFVILVGEIAGVISVFTVGYQSGQHGLFVAAYFVSTSVFYFSCLILAFVLYMISIQLVPRRQKFDYVVIHGCGLIGGTRVSRLLGNRIDKAIDIYNRSRVKPMLIPSGGKGSDEAMSEAEAMKQYMVERGIPEDHILMEDQSKTTMENLRNSKNLILAREGGHKTALVSSNYHIYRCMIYANKLKWRCTGVGAKVAWYYWPSATLREFAAVFTKPPIVIWTAVGYLLFTVIPTIAMLS